MNRLSKFLLIVLLLLVVGLVAFSGVFQSVVSGDQFYDERCVDVSQYLSQGYSNLRVDSHGCQIVGKVVSDVQFPTGVCGGAGATWVRFPDVVVSQCSSFNGGVRNSGYSNCLFCVQNSFDEKGGFERVLNSCSADPGDILVAESFAGGHSISRADLRYPLKAFCRAHPSIVTDGLTSYSSTNIPQDLVDGKSVSLPSGSTVTIFYYIANSYNLPSKCSSSDNLALDLSTNSTCKSTLGFTYLCSEGVWDALSGSCTVMRTVECKVGERLTVNSDGSKVCVFNPPLQVDCPKGFVFNPDLSVCERVPESVFVCASPYVLFEPTQSECRGVWELCPQCPTDKICDQSICKPQCSEGISCVFNPSCINSSLVDGQCVTNTSKVSACPSGSVWDLLVEACVSTPDMISSCPDGLDPINGVCMSLPKDFVRCPSAQVLSGGKCVDSSVLTAPKFVSGVSVPMIFWIILVFIVVLFVASLFVKRKGGRRH